MDTVEISVERRSPAGKGSARRLRRAGKIPAVLYGAACGSSVHVAVGTREFEDRVGRLEGAHLIRLLHPTAADTEIHEKVVLLRGIQRHPVTGQVLHADFFAINLQERLMVSVPLRFVGKAAGVVAGGILQPVLREIAVECLPAEIPEYVEVDVSRLGIHEAIHVRDIVVPVGISLPGDGGKTIVTVLPPTVEEVKAAAEATEAPVEGQPADGVTTQASEVASKKSTEGA